MIENFIVTEIYNDIESLQIRVNAKNVGVFEFLEDCGFTAEGFRRIAVAQKEFFLDPKSIEKLALPFFENPYDVPIKSLAKPSAWKRKKVVEKTLIDNFVSLATSFFSTFGGKKENALVKPLEFSSPPQGIEPPIAKTLAEEINAKVLARK